MDFLRQYFWLLVIIGMVFVCVVIGLVFFFINKCISQEVKIPQMSEQKVKQTCFCHGQNVSVQFYELAANQEKYYNGKHRIAQLQNASDFRASCNQYQERFLHEEETPPLPPRFQFLTAEAQSYENLADVPDYEQSVVDLPDYEQNVTDQQDYEQNYDEQRDYIKVKNEEPNLPLPPPYEDQGVADDISMEDYDDIGGEDENQGEEDYDDVG